MSEEKVRILRAEWLLIQKVTAAFDDYRRSCAVSPHSMTLLWVDADAAPLVTFDEATFTEAQAAAAKRLVELLASKVDHASLPEATTDEMRRLFALVTMTKSSVNFERLN